MLSCPDCIKVPEEFRSRASALFPPSNVSFAGDKALLQASRDFAEILGVASGYLRLLSLAESPQRNSADIAKFLDSFRNNLDLLIQKTWVEKADEARKEKLQSGIPSFIKLIKNSEYKKALEVFGAILEELAWLLFGAQSRKDDFAEYLFRIDTQLGLFWWYGGQIGRFLAGSGKGASNETLGAILFLGLCYLTEF